MVVLDEGGVVQAEAMVGAAARAHRIFLDRAQERRGLACADDARLGMRHRGRKPRGRARDPAEAANEVERCALGREHPARRSFDDRERRSGGDLGAVGEARLEADRRVDEAVGAGGEIESGLDALLLGGHDAPHYIIGRRNGVGRDVAGAAEVLQKRLADERLGDYRGEGNSPPFFKRLFGLRGRDRTACRF